MIDLPQSANTLWTFLTLAHNNKWNNNNPIMKMHFDSEALKITITNLLTKQLKQSGK